MHDFSLYDTDTALTAQELLAHRSRAGAPRTEPLVSACSTPLSEVGGLRLHVLGSGSQGNCAVIESTQGAVLVDCGFSKKETFQRLEALGIARSSIKAILITHEHSDHIKGVGVVSRGLCIPVYATYETASYHPLAREVSALPIHVRDRFEVAGITITTFPTSHDARQPIGMRFEADHDAIGYLTDTGTVSPEAKELLYDTRILALESNHNETMLQKGPYPYRLKQRIASDLGHLSNDQAASVAGELQSRRLETIVGMHLSETNNTTDKAEAALRQHYQDGSVLIAAARQNLPRTFV